MEKVPSCPPTRLGTQGICTTTEKGGRERLPTPSPVPRPPLEHLSAPVHENTKRLPPALPRSLPTVRPDGQLHFHRVVLNVHQAFTQEVFF